MKYFKYIIKQLLVALLVAELCIPAIPLYAADITIDTSVPVRQRPTLDRAQNGVTIINLSTTTAGGVSVNRFTEFNVGPSGIILNNSANMGVSVLGGAIYGNPNYQCDGREASIVINEVTGTKRTDLLGYTEMFGKAAEYILVNPNGIMCNGAGFVNMPRVTLGTGRAMYDANGFSGIDVRGGMVSIEGKGIEAGKVDYFTIVTRMAAVKGGIWGKDVNITTGTGTYNYRNASFTQADTGTEKPEISVDASALGSIYAGRIKIISNEKGVGVKSNADMLADVSDITIAADGSIELNNTQAAGNIQVASNSDRIIQRGDAFAMGNISYRGKGVTNRGTVKAVKSVFVEGLVDNQGGVITANENIDFHTGGTLSNDGGSITLAGDTGRIRIYGNDSLTVQGGVLKSAGSIDIDMMGNVVFAPGTSSVYADKSFKVKGINFTNSTSISVNGSVDINVSGDLLNNNDGSLISNNGFKLVSGGRITNSGVISGDSVDITGASLDNNANAEITGGSSSSKVNITGAINNSGRISGASDLGVTASAITNTDELSEISSGGNLTVDTGILQNNKGLLFSAADMSITAKTLNNIRGTLYSMGNMVLKGKAATGNSIYNYSGYIETEGSLAVSIGSDGRLENTGLDEGSYTSELQTVGGYGNEHYALMQQMKLNSTMTTDSSFFVSGGDMTINAGDVENHGSVMSSGNNLTINADRVINETNSQKVYLSHYQYWGKREEHRKKWYKGWKKYHDHHERWTGGTVEVVSEDKAVMQGKNVVINADSVFNGNSADYSSTVIYDNADSIKNAGFLADAVEKSGKVGATANKPGAIEDVKTTGAIDLSAYISNSAGSPLFNIDKDPSSKYLIETRVQYVDVSKLKGSEYLLERINYNPETDLRFLGDAFYEQKLVNQAILKSTSRKFLADNLKSDQDQMAWLLDNAASAYKDLNLAVGVALTKEQINRLQQPIIWYVEDVVMGSKVLVPRVYIPGHILDGFSLDSGSMIAGDTVKIDAEKSVYNSGTISGNRSVDIAAGGSITNSGGTVKSGGDMNLSTESGDIINETRVYSTETSFGYVTAEPGRTGTIQSGGNLTVNSGGDFVNRGADVKADGNADITAAGNIDFETVQVRNRGYSEQYGTSGISDTTTVTGSNLTVGGNLSMNSGRDINFIGSSADIAGDADIKTEGNFNLINDYNTSHYEGTKTKSGALSSSTTTVVADTKTVVGSSFTTGGDLNVDSGNDINIVGSDVSAGRNANLNAEGTQNIIAVHDESYYSRTKETSGFGAGGSIYGSEKKTDMVYDKTVNGSAVDIKGKYASNSGGDTNIIGSSITAGEAEITTGGNLNIIAAYNEHAEEHKTEKSGIGMNWDVYSMELDMEGKGSTTAAGATINAGKLTLKSENDILIEGSIINSDNADIKAAGNFTETSAKETSYEYSVHEKMSFTADIVKDMAKAYMKDMALATFTGGTALLFTSSELVDFEKGRLSVTIASGEYEKSKTRTDIITQRSSSINTSENLSIDSGKDLTIAGSDINSGGDTTLTAAGNVSIETTEESTETTSEKMSGSFELTVGVKHQASEVYYAAKALKESYDKLKVAKEAYDDYRKSKDKAESDYKNGLIDRDELDDITDPKMEAMYLANITLCAADVAAKTAVLIQQTGTAAASTETFGFNADAQLDIDALIEKSHELSVTSKGSNINTGGSLTINSGSTAKIKGSNVSASEDITIDAKNVEIIAAENSNESGSDSKNAHLNVTYSAVGGWSGSASASMTESDSSGTTYTNSHLNASNITIKSSEDTTVRGGVVAAENNLTMDVDGNLTVESVQDRSKNNSWTLGVSGGYGGGSGNIGVNGNMSKGSSKWVSEQTSLSGGSVNIDVAEKTTLRGAVIDSTTGDLTLATGSLEYSNIKDRNSSTSIGGGVNVSNGDVVQRDSTGKVKTVKDENGNDKALVENETEFGPDSASFGFSDSRQTNFATIGAGTIIVRDGNTDLSKLNRDVSKAQYGTMDLGVQLSADKDMFNMILRPVDTFGKTMDGLSQIAERGRKIEEQTHVVEKTGNLVTDGHYAMNGQLIYYDNIDEYNNLKAIGGVITSQQELIYIGSRELIGDPLSNEELKDTSISYLQKRGDEYTVEGATKGYFKDYSNTLMFNNYLDLKLELINNGIDLLPLTDSDKINFSKTLNQEKGGALSIQLQNELRLSPEQADFIAVRSCKAGTEYMLLKLGGSNVSTYPSFFRENNSEGLISNRAEVKYGLVEKYGYKLTENKNYDDLVNGKGSNNVEIRILQNYGQKNEKGNYERHSIYGYTSTDDGVKNISDMSNRGYGKSVEEAVEKNNGSQKEYFEYFNYLEKLPKKAEK